MQKPAGKIRVKEQLEGWLAGGGVWQRVRGSTSPCPSPFTVSDRHEVSSSPPPGPVLPTLQPAHDGLKMNHDSHFPLYPVGTECCVSAMEKVTKPSSHHFVIYFYLLTSLCVFVCILSRFISYSMVVFLNQSYWWILY